MKKKLFAIILAGVLAAGLAACGNSGAKEASSAETAASPVDDGVLTVGFDAEYPPYGYMDDNGEYTIPVRRMICSTGTQATVSKTSRF